MGAGIKNGIAIEFFLFLLRAFSPPGISPLRAFSPLFYRVFVPSDSIDRSPRALVQNNGWVVAKWSGRRKIESSVLSASNGGIVEHALRCYNFLVKRPREDTSRTIGRALLSINGSRLVRFLTPSLVRVVNARWFSISAPSKVTRVASEFMVGKNVPWN